MSLIHFHGPRSWVVCLLFLSFQLLTHAQPGAIDPTFNPTDIGFGSGDGANSDILSTAVQADGKIIIVGAFTSFNDTGRNRIARLNADGSLDTGFNPGTGAVNSIRSIAVQSDGKILIGGFFTSYNGTGRNRIARLNTDGSLDTGFNPGTGADNGVSTIAVQADGKILIGGSFTSYNGTGRNRIARLNADGSLDTSFNPGTGANLNIISTALQSDGKILIGGEFTSYNGTGRNYIARLNADGSLDTGFNPGTGATNSIFSTSVQSDGKILIGGTFTSYNGTGRNRIARLNADGSLDTGFNPGSGAESFILSISLQPDGKILIGGGFTSYNATARNRIARLNADGSLDTGFNPGSGANNSLQSITVQVDGKILIGGFLTSYNGTGLNRIARVNADGSLDNGFNPVTGANGLVAPIALQADGKILIGGQFTSYNDIGRNRIARLNANGSLDTGFNPGTGTSGPIFSIALQADGKILIGGDFFDYNGTGRNRIARLNAEGGLDTGFNPGSGADNQVWSIATQGDGKILIGGFFTSYNGTGRNRIARLNTDGSLDTGFNPGTGANTSLLSITVQPDGKILIGGGFTSYNGTGRNRIARLNANGSLDTGFNPGTGASNTIRSTAVQSDGKILIGGDFTSYNGTGRNYIARLNTDGSLDSGFNPGAGANGTIRSIVVLSDGKILIVGEFTSYNGTGRNRIARLNADGSLDTGFNPGTGANNQVWSIATQGDGKILIGGFFTSYNGTGRNRIARVQGVYDCPLLSANFGDPCDDGDPLTGSDTVNGSCVCAGVVLNSIGVTFSPTPLCADNTTNYLVQYSATGSYNPGNNWVLELSDAAGSFATPTVIGQLASAALSGDIVGTIPLGTPAGSGYRLRVRSTDPLVTGADNGTNITISSPLTWYLDFDNDGFAASIIQSCTSPGAGYTLSALPVTDCNDGDAAITPNTTWYQDADNDGFAASTTQSCTSPGAGYTLNALPLTDCNDGSAAINPNTVWYLDADNDGFALSTAQSCTSPGAGYTLTVLPVTDCNDNNSAINPNTVWYLDFDNDGFAVSTAQSCTSPGAGYTLTVLPLTDCNDGNANILPGAAELCNGVDDDCDGITDEGCGSGNDFIGGAVNIPNSSVGSCTTINGTLAGATPDPQPGATVVTGEDVWYVFTSISTAVSIECATSAANVLLELRTVGGTLIDTENAVSTVGTERMNIGGLTVGQTYYLRVRNFNSAQGTGAFTLCLRPLRAAQCNLVPGPYSVCGSFKSTHVAANQYQFTFDAVGPAPALFATTTNGITTVQLGSVAGITYNTTYEVTVNAVYNLTDGAGTPEVFTVPYATAPCTMVTAPHTDPDLRSSDAAPNIRFKNSIIGADRWICGATSLEFEFTQQTPLVGVPFAVNNNAPSRLINLYPIAGIVPGATYLVRIRPMFGAVGGDWGPDSQTLIIAGPASMAAEEEMVAFESAEGIQANLFPNPTQGDRINLAVDGAEGNLIIRIYDALGREVWNGNRVSEGSLRTTLEMGQTLEGGVYEFVILAGEERVTRRFVVTE
jgi:uncharacterized delta-60 repeat protein